MSGMIKPGGDPNMFDQEENKPESEGGDLDNIEVAKSTGTEVLDKSDIDKAGRMIDQRYPLNDSSISDVFPMLKPLTFWYKNKDKVKKSNVLK